MHHVLKWNGALVLANQLVFLPYSFWIFIFTSWSWIDATTRHFKNRRTQNCYLKSSTVKWDVVWNELLCGSSCLQLSPALRNRFTEIWCPQSNGRDDLIQIVKHNLHPGLSLTGMKRQGRYFLCVGLQTLLRKKKDLLLLNLSEFTQMCTFYWKYSSLWGQLQNIMDSALHS